MTEHYKTFCQELTHTHTLNEFSQTIHAIVKKLGLTDFLFVRLERQWHTGSQHGLLYSLPGQLMRTYLDNQMQQNDLLITYGKANTCPIFSSQVYGYMNEAPFDIDLTIKNRQLLQLHRRFYYFEHYVISERASNDNGNVQLRLTSRGENQQQLRSLVTPVMSVCQSLCKAIDSVSTKKFHASFIDRQDKPFGLTERPVQLLHQLAVNDISIEELAKKLSISPATAHQHILAARKALRVKTNIGAVLKAIKLGLIVV